jgi:hypothetical protein
MLLLRWLFLPVQVSCGGSENCLMDLKLIISTILMADDREIIIPILNRGIKRASRGVEFGFEIMNLLLSYVVVFMSVSVYGL